MKKRVAVIILIILIVSLPLILAYLTFNLSKLSSSSGTELRKSSKEIFDG